MRRLLPLLISATMLAAACGSGDDTGGSATTADPPSSAPDTSPDSAPAAPTATSTAPSPPPTRSESPTTSIAPPSVTAAELAAPGPYPVGVITRDLPEGGLVEIWYPADQAAAGGTETYALRSFLPPSIEALVPPDVDDTLTIDATRDASAADDGPFPIVLSSHGAAGFRLISSVLAQHLASWGIVTASTDHPSRDLLNFLGGTSEGQPPAADQLRSMRAMLSTLDADPILGGVLDTERVALGGHSAGGGTIADVALDDDIAGYVSYSSGLRDDVPEVPSLFLAGELDAVIDVSRTQEAFEQATSPSWLWVFADTGHQGFTDVCLFGGGEATLVELADAAGLGDFVDEGLRSLATDGCEEPNRPVVDVAPGVFQSSTGFYRWVFGIDSEPIGLDASAVTPDVTIDSK